MVRGEILDGVERRRRWLYEDKVRIVEESFVPGVTIAAVARRNRISASLIFTWRKLAKAGQLGGGEVAPILVPVALTPPVMSAPVLVDGIPASSGPAPEVPRRHRSSGIIEINLGSGCRLKVDRDVDAEALKRVLGVLAKR